MKKIFLISLLFIAFQTMQAQKITIDIDSIADNKTVILSQKWQKTKDSVRIVTWKVNGQVYGDSTRGNVNITIEWKLDTSNAIKFLQNRIDEQRKSERDQKEADLQRFYQKNPDLKPIVKNAKLGIISDVPKNYNVVVVAPKKQRRYWLKNDFLILLK